MSNQKKTHYFDPREFSNKVIADMKLGEVNVETLDALHEQIELMLSERILDAVIRSFGVRELDLFEKILEDHPELDEIDALMVLAPGVSGVKEGLEHAIQSLYQELVNEAVMVEKVLNKPLAV